MVYIFGILSFVCSTQECLCLFCLPSGGGERIAFYFYFHVNVNTNESNCYCNHYFISFHFCLCFITPRAKWKEQKKWHEWCVCGGTPGELKIWRYAVWCAMNNNTRKKAKFIHFHFDGTHERKNERKGREKNWCVCVCVFAMVGAKCSFTYVKYLYVMSIVCNNVTNTRHILLRMQHNLAK